MCYCVLCALVYVCVCVAAEELFYPCSGRTTAATATDNNIINIGLTPIGPGPWDSRARAKLSYTHRQELINLANAELRYVKWPLLVRIRLSK
jgi:hypothetical protein